eukprot:11411239-Ditylum_brightwellii.AAC.1
MNPPESYQQGNQQIDFIFITPGTLPTVLIAGFLPYNTPFLSDHRTLFVDFDTQTLFLGNYDNPNHHTTRKPIATNPKCNDKYVNILSKHLENHNIPTQVKDLQAELREQGKSTQEGISRYNNLDKERARLMLHAKKDAGTAHMDLHGQWNW